MATTATTIRERHRYKLGPYEVWYEQKPGQGRRVTLFVKTPGMTIVEHIDRTPQSEENESNAD